MALGCQLLVVLCPHVHHFIACDCGEFILFTAKKEISITVDFACKVISTLFALSQVKGLCSYYLLFHKVGRTPGERSITPILMIAGNITGSF